MKKLYDRLKYLENHLVGNYKLIEMIQTYVCETIDDGNYEEAYDFAMYVSNTLGKIKTDLSISEDYENEGDAKNSEHHYYQARWDLSRLIALVYDKLQKVEV